MALLTSTRHRQTCRASQLILSETCHGLIWDDRQKYLNCREIHEAVLGQPAARLLLGTECSTALGTECSTAGPISSQNSCQAAVMSMPQLLQWRELGTQAPHQHQLAQPCEQG